MEKLETLHLILKRKWWEMIAFCGKTEEYRDFTPFYINRLCDNPRFNSKGEIIGRQSIGRWTLDACERRGIDLKKAWEDGNMIPKNFSYVTLHLGYTNKIMIFDIKSIRVGEGRPEWGAEPGKQYFIIELGERL